MEGSDTGTDDGRPFLPVEARFWLLLYPRMAAFSRQLQRRTCLSMTEIAVLLALHDTAATEVRALRRAIAADAGHLSRVLASFEGVGMLVSTASADDGRMRQVRLTGLGAERRLAVGLAAAQIAGEMPRGAWRCDVQGRKDGKR